MFFWLEPRASSDRRLLAASSPRVMKYLLQGGGLWRSSPAFAMRI